MQPINSLPILTTDDVLRHYSIPDQKNLLQSIMSPALVGALLHLHWQFFLRMVKQSVFIPQN